MSCPIPAQNLLARRQYRRYVGAAVINSGGYPYALSDTVPINQYWIVWTASCVAGFATQLPAPYSLILIQNGALLPKLPAGATGDDPFFLDYFAFPSRAFGPEAYGLRVDRYGLATGGLGVNPQPQRVGDECQMIDRPLLVGPGETLMGWNQYSATPANVGAKMELRLALSVMQSTEDLELEF